MSEWLPGMTEEMIAERDRRIAQHESVDVDFDASGCQMCGAHPDDPCDCFDPQEGS